MKEERSEKFKRRKMGDYLDLLKGKVDGNVGVLGGLGGLAGIRGDGGVAEADAEDEGETSLTATDGVGVAEAKMPAALIEVAEDSTSAWTKGATRALPAGAGTFDIVGLRPGVTCWTASTIAANCSALSCLAAATASLPNKV